MHVLLWSQQGIRAYDTVQFFSGCETMKEKGGWPDL